MGPFAETARREGMAQSPVAGAREPQHGVDDVQVRARSLMAVREPDASSCLQEGLITLVIDQVRLDAANSSVGKRSTAFKTTELPSRQSYRTTPV